MSQAAARPDQFVFITPVWGDAYTERFLKVSLPSQLAPGNLPAVPADRAEFLIYTLKPHVDAIRRAPSYRALRKLMPVKLLSLDDLPNPSLELTPHPHQLQTAAYLRGIARADGRSAAFVFVVPDMLVGDGGYRRMVELVDGGTRVLMVCGLRMTNDGAVAAVARHPAGKGVAAIPPRSLVRAGLDHLHPISRGSVVEEDGYRVPQHLYWQVKDHGLLVRGYHLHPLAVWPENPAAGIRNSVDDEYVGQACPDRSRWHVVDDSDEIVVFEFSDPNHKSGMVSYRPLTDAEILRFLRTGTTPDHRGFARRRIRFHSEPLGDADWGPVEARSDAHLAAAERLFADGLPEPPVPLPAASEPAALPEPRVLADVGPVNTLRRLARAAQFPLRLLHRGLYGRFARLASEHHETRSQLNEARVRLAHALDRVERLERIDMARRQAG